MSDILERLADHARVTMFDVDDAAAEITRLRAEVGRLLGPEPSRGGPPGDGWRFLRHDETVLEGDEFLDTSAMSFGWKPTRDAGKKAGGMFYRRRVEPVAEMLTAVREAQEERTISAAEAAALGPDAPKNRPTVEAKSLPSRPEDAATEDRTEDSWLHEIVLRDYRGQPVVIGQDMDGDIGIISHDGYSIIVGQQEAHKFSAWLAEFAARRGIAGAVPAPQPTLTDAEREALDYFGFFGGGVNLDTTRNAATLRALHERATSKKTET